MARHSFAILPVALALATACGAPDSATEADPNLDSSDVPQEVDDALSLGCGSYPPEKVFVGSITTPYAARSYARGCNRDTIMLQLTRADGTSQRTPIVLEPMSDILTPGECIRTQASFDVWEVTGWNARLIGTRTVIGTLPRFGVRQKCELSLPVPAQLAPGKTYKLGVSIRQGEKLLPLTLSQAEEGFRVQANAGLPANVAAGSDADAGSGAGAEQAGEKGN